MFSIRAGSVVKRKCSLSLSTTSLSTMTTKTVTPKSKLQNFTIEFTNRQWFIFKNPKVVRRLKLIFFFRNCTQRTWLAEKKVFCRQKVAKESKTCFDNACHCDVSCSMHASEMSLTSICITSLRPSESHGASFGRQENIRFIYYRIHILFQFIVHVGRVCLTGACDGWYSRCELTICSWYVSHAHMHTQIPV